MEKLLVTIAFCSAAAAGGIVDRVAVVVGTDVITESEVLHEVRLTQYLNGDSLDFSVAQRKAAAERLVDQQLIRNEMQTGGYAMPAESEGEAVLRSFRQQNYGSIPAFRTALEKYGLTEDEVKRRLLWQTAALRFTDQRFHMMIPAQPEQSPSQSPAQSSAQSSSQSSADRSSNADASSGTAEDQMDVWLKAARGNTRIQFKKGAFQ